jgi:predicted DNA-binding transcriptional regulator AlpA
MTNSPTQPERYLRTEEAARLLGLSGSTLEKHRVFNTGPMYMKIGGRVVYEVDELMWWAKQTRRSGTKDESAANITTTTRRTLTTPREPSS